MPLDAKEANSPTGLYLSASVGLYNEDSFSETRGKSVLSRAPRTEPTGIALIDFDEGDYIRVSFYYTLRRDEHIHPSCLE